MKRSARQRFVQAWVAKHDCFWCGKLFTYRGHHAPTVEHFIPRSRGGRNWQANLVVAHYGCNMRRTNRIPNEDEMRAFVKIKGKIGLHNLRIFAEEIERSLVDSGVERASLGRTPTASTAVAES